MNKRYILALALAALLLLVGCKAEPAAPAEQPREDGPAPAPVTIALDKGPVTRVELEDRTGAVQKLAYGLNYHLVNALCGTYEPVCRTGEGTAGERITVRIHNSTGGVMLEQVFTAGSWMLEQEGWLFVKSGEDMEAVMAAAAAGTEHLYIDVPYPTQHQLVLERDHVTRITVLWPDQQPGEAVNCPEKYMEDLLALLNGDYEPVEGPETENLGTRRIVIHIYGPERLYDRTMVFTENGLWERDGKFYRRKEYSMAHVLNRIWQWGHYDLVEIKGAEPLPPVDQRADLSTLPTVSIRPDLSAIGSIQVERYRTTPGMPNFETVFDRQQIADLLYPLWGEYKAVEYDDENLFADDEITEISLRDAHGVEFEKLIFRNDDLLVRDGIRYRRIDSTLHLAVSTILKE